VFRGGVWKGRLTGFAAGTPPEVTISGDGGILPGVSLAPDGQGAWIISVPIPAESLGEGIVAFVVTDAHSGTRVGEIVIAVGGAADDDLRAELGLLRAELELLKRAVRRLSGGGGSA
jgi:hypothetical protein